MGKEREEREGRWNYEIRRTLHGLCHHGLERILSLLLSSITSMMMRLLLDVSICFCPTSEPLLLVQSTSLLLYLHLHCPSISSVVFLGFFPH